tara:strand:+ start:260 stop:529 length:270 start_codon:yes stop_codon:yes gene_type:complete
MKTFYTIVITSLLCSLLWIGGTVMIIDEYIKVVQIKDFQNKAVEGNLAISKNLNKLYERVIIDIVWKCQNRFEISVAGKNYICWKIDKV